MIEICYRVFTNLQQTPDKISREKRELAALDLLKDFRQDIRSTLLA